MGSKRALERRLATIGGFAHPRVDLEQYPTPADIAAQLVHLADLEGDVAGSTVVDLGTGTGVLALGCALRGAQRVLGVERDVRALAIARQNERQLDPPVTVDWLLADAMRAPLCPGEPVTVLMNPPFGAQRGSAHADRAFLSTASEIAAVSYSFHNAGSEEFVSAFATDNGGECTHAVAVSFDLEHQFDFHTEERAVVPVECYRIEWNG